MEDLVSGLAATLGELRRSPGRDEGWVIKVLAELQKTCPQDHDFLQQRLDFATRLGKLAGVSEARVAAASVGLLFENLAALGPEKKDARPPRPWTQYLDRNSEWLAPALVVARAIQRPTWAECAQHPEAVVAKTSHVFVGETYMRHPKLLSELESAANEADSGSVERIVTALRSEEGQQLCDRHMRLRGQHWVLSPTDLRESLRILKRAPHEAALVPPALVTPTTARTEEPKDDPAERRKVAVAAATSDNFQRRKEALRASTSPSDPADLAGGDEVRPAASTDSGDANIEVAEPVGERVLVAPPSAEPEQAVSLASAIAPPTPPQTEPEPAAVEPRPAVAKDEPAVSLNDTEPRVQQRGQEEEMQMNNEQPELRLTDAIQALRSRIDEMERTAAEAREILATLGPKMEEFSAWADELEAVVRRRSGRAESKDTAA